VFTIDLPPLPLQAGHNQRIVEAVAILFDVIEKVDQSDLCHSSLYVYEYLCIFKGENGIKSSAQVDCV
jgi:hypothetical protein